MPKIRLTITYEYNLSKKFDPEAILTADKIMFKEDANLFQQEIANNKGTKMKESWEIIP